MSDFILAIDQGTTGTTVFLFDETGRPAAKAYREFTQHYPRPGWVEHDAQEIWDVTATLIKDLVERRLGDGRIAAIGVTNQRETTLIWDKKTGEPVAPAIVWQCRRTANICNRLRQEGLGDLIRRKTGLVIDAYFSGTKIKWLLDSDAGLRRRAERGELAFGTIDSWLVWNLSGGQVHVTDYTNASRTMIFDIHRLRWDSELLDLLQIPQGLLPEVASSSEIYGRTKGVRVLPDGIPIAGIAGDQQAALFGQTCYQPGMVKATYGTGSFILMNTGKEPKESANGLLTTIAWGLGSSVDYALEGSIFMAGATVQWLRDELRIIRNADETEAMAYALEDNEGVYFVPAFVGLGAPYWDSYARGTIIGLTRGANRNHFARSVLEAIAYQTKDVVDIMADDSQISVQTVKVDGGACVNNFLMQFQADMLRVPILRPKVFETTALGAAYLAGLAVGFWERSDLSSLWQAEHRFEPTMPVEERDRLYAGWKRAVARSREWVVDSDE